MPPNSPRSPRTAQNSPFVRRRTATPRRRLMVRAADWLVLLVIVAGLTYSLIVSPQPAVIVSSNAYHSNSIYQKVAIESMNGLAFRSKLTFNTEKVSASLKQQFPEIKSASVELPLIGQRPMVHLDIANPAFLFNSHGHNYILDSAGVVVAESSVFPHIKDLLPLYDQSGFNIKTGAQAISSDSIDFLNQIVAQARHAKVPIKSLTLPALPQEVDLRTADASYYVKFYLGGDPVLQSGQFLGARHQFHAGNIKPSTYLDVRVPGKIFYK